MHKLLLSPLVLAALAATPAMAQEEAPFSGPWAAGIAGYDDFDGAKGNLLYGGQIGYDFDASGAVIGIEGEFSDSDVKARDTNVIDVGDSVRINTDRDLYAGIRIGGRITPTTMLYAKGGYTNARFEGRFTPGTTTGDGEPVNAVDPTDNGVTADGYRLGAGLEQQFNMLGPRGFIKAEYRYSNYQNIDLGGDDVDFRTDFDRHQVAVGLGVRF